MQYCYDFVNFRCCNTCNTISCNKVYRNAVIINLKFKCISLLNKFVKILQYCYDFMFRCNSCCNTSLAVLAILVSCNNTVMTLTTLSFDAILQYCYDLTRIVMTAYVNTDLFFSRLVKRSESWIPVTSPVNLLVN